MPETRKEAIGLVLAAFNVVAQQRVNTPLMETMFQGIDALRLLGVSDVEISDAISGLGLKLS